MSFRFIYSNMFWNAVGLLAGAKVAIELLKIS